MRACRLLVVDDNPGILDSLRSLLEKNGLEVVGSAASGREAVERVALLAPDLILMDVVMPGMDGLQATRRLCKSPQRPRIILMTSHDDEEYRTAALKAGADGFCFKWELNAKLIALIHGLFPDDTESQDSAFS